VRAFFVVGWADWVVEIGLATAVQVTVDANGHTEVVTSSGPGDWFGEMGVVGRHPHTATVLAQTDARVRSFPASPFPDAVQASATIADSFTRAMRVRLARAGPVPGVP
jgi:CRP-like cAMP-binding protein